MRARQPVIPSGPELSFRAKPNVIPSELSFRATRTVIPSEAELIPSEAELSFRAAPELSFRATELSFRADPNCHSERTRIPSEAELSFRAKPRNLPERCFDCASGCAFSSAQHDRHPFTSFKIMPILVQ